MAKKANTSKAAAKAVAKKPDLIETPAELSDLSEEQLRDQARQDTDALARDGAEADVEMTSVTIARPGFMREAGGKVSPGQTLELPVSVVALYERTQGDLFEGSRVTNDDGSKPRPGTAGGVQADGKVTNDHNAEGDVTN